jgi:anti-sigma-K factor RskA
MNCNEVRELLPAYVLGALDGDEVEVVEAHLRAGHEHDDELLRLRTTVFALDRFADERSLEAPQAVRQPRLAWPRGLMARKLNGLNFASPRRMAVAAAVALAIVGLGWMLAGQTGGSDAWYFSLALQGPRGEMMALTGTTSQASVSVVMAGLERLPPDRVYQIWAIRDGTWLKVGACNTNQEGGWKGEFPFKIRSGERIALTVEPAEGSNFPTSVPVLISSS